MAFSTEMKDFFTAFRTTSSVVDEFQTRRLNRDKERRLREENPSLDELGSGYPGYQPIDPPPSSEPEVQTDDEDNAEDVEVSPVAGETNRDRQEYAIPDETNRDRQEYYAAGGAIRIGTQPGRLPVDMSKMNKDLLARWQRTQKAYGREFNIVSGYRSPKRNKKAGGAKKSQHIHGNAIDIDVSGLSRPERLRLIQTASANGMTGIGVYNNSLHFDVGNRRAWGPNYKFTGIPKWARGMIDQHLAGKLGDYSPEATRAGKITAQASADRAIPEPDTEDYTDIEPTEDEETLGDRFAEEEFYTAASAGRDQEEQSPALENFYENEGIDISAIDVPQPRVYQPGDMTGAPRATAYAAAGGSVPWAGDTSYVRGRMGGSTRGPMGSYFQRRPYVPNSNSASAYTPPATPKPPNPWNNDPMEYILKYQHIYSPEWLRFADKMGFADNGRGGFRYAPPPVQQAIGAVLSGGFAEGGSVPGKEDLEADAQVLEALPQQRAGALTDLEAQPIPRPRLRPDQVPKPTRIQKRDLGVPASALPDPDVPPVPNRAGRSDREDYNPPDKREPVGLFKAIDLGLKYLTRSLGLDRAGTAVGPDRDLSRRREMLVKGAVAENEGPPTPDEMKQVFTTVDPNGELDESLRTIYAMRKGVEFYLKRGDDVKAAKWAANLIQFSNLVSRQYGVEAVKAGKAGDAEGMMRLAVKSYDAIPDGLSASAKMENGQIAVTRTDEEGNVVDVHRLTPQQVFQMATGISAGTGYFDALIDVANRGKASGKRSSGATPEQVEARKGAMRSRYKDVSRFSSEGDREAFEMALEAGDWQTANDIIRDAGGNAPKPDKPLTPAEQRIQKSQQAQTQVYSSLLPDIESAMTEKEKEAWAIAVEANQPSAVKDLYDNVKSRMSKEEQKVLKVKKIAGLKELRGDYETDLSPSQKKALDAAFAENDVDTVDRVYSAIDKKRQDKQDEIDRENRYNTQEADREKRAAAKAAQEDAKAKTKEEQDAIKAAKLKEPSRRDLNDIGMEVDATVNSLFTSDADVDGADVPAYVDEAVGPGTYNRVRSLATNIAAYNQLPVADSLDFMTDILTNPDAVSFNNDVAGNLVVETPSGLFKLPPSERKKIDALMGAGVAIDDGWGSGYGYNVTKTRESGGPQEAIPTTPAPPAPPAAPTPAGNAGRPMPPDVLAKAKQAIAQGRSRAGVVQKLLDQGYNPAGL